MENPPPPPYSLRPANSDGDHESLTRVIYEGYTKWEAFQHFLLVHNLGAKTCTFCQRWGSQPSKALVLYDRLLSRAPIARQTTINGLLPVLRDSEVREWVQLGPTLSIQWSKLVRAVSRLQGSPSRLSALIATGVRMKRPAKSTLGLRTVTHAKWRDGRLLVQTTSYALAHEVLKTDRERSGVRSVLPTCVHCHASATLAQWFLAARDMIVLRAERMSRCVLKCARCPSEYLVAVSLRSPCHLPDGGKASIKDLEYNEAWVVKCTRWTDLGPCSSLQDLRAVLRQNTTSNGAASPLGIVAGAPGDILCAFEGITPRPGKVYGQILRPATWFTTDSPSWSDILRSCETQHRRCDMPVRCEHGLCYDVSHVNCKDIRVFDQHSGLI